LLGPETLKLKTSKGSLIYSIDLTRTQPVKLFTISFISILLTFFQTCFRFSSANTGLFETKGKENRAKKAAAINAANILEIFATGNLIPQL
jgi:hypothetical protein